MRMRRRKNSAVPPSDIHFQTFRVAALGAVLLASAASLFAQDGTRKLSLSEAVDLALRQNRDLQLAQLSVFATEAKKDQARAAYFPKIRNESGITHVTELAGVQIPAGAFGNPSSTGPIPAETLFIGQGSSTSYTSGTGLVQPVTQMFRISASNRAADADLKTSQIQVGEAENLIALKVRQVYFSILIAQEQLDAARFDLAANQTKAEETRQNISEGKSLEVAGLESRAALLNAKQSVVTQEIKLRDLMLQLNELLGLPLEAHLSLDQSEAAFRLPLPSRQEAVQRVLSHSPVVKAAEQMLLKAKAGHAAAKDSYIPDVTGLARYSYQSGIPFLAHKFGTFGFTLTYDLFDGGKRKAELDESRARIRQAEVNLDKVKEEATIQIETAYNRLEQLDGLIGVSDESLQTRKELARITAEQFSRDAALASSRDEAIARLRQAEASHLEAILGRALSEADVLRILGESPR